LLNRGNTAQQAQPTDVQVDGESPADQSIDLDADAFEEHRARVRRHGLLVLAVVMVILYLCTSEYILEAVGIMQFILAVLKAMGG
jgi:hypothetical protein